MKNWCQSSWSFLLELVERLVGEGEFSLQQVTEGTLFLILAGGSTGCVGCSNFIKHLLTTCDRWRKICWKSWVLFP